MVGNPVRQLRPAQWRSIYAQPPLHKPLDLFAGYNDIVDQTAQQPTRPVAQRRWNSHDRTLAANDLAKSGQ